eukprot:3233254-Rhodomonas_salina.1
MVSVVEVSAPRIHAPQNARQLPAMVVVVAFAPRARLLPVVELAVPAGPSVGSVSPVCQKTVLTLSPRHCHALQRTARIHCVPTWSDGHVTFDRKVGHLEAHSLSELVSSSRDQRRMCTPGWRSKASVTEGTVPS